MTKRIVRYMQCHFVAFLALFVALGGTSIAATQLAKNSVGSPQVINGSLQTIDMSKKARAALKGKRGARGAAGAQGGQGAKGATGAAGPLGPVGAGNLKGATSVVGVGVPVAAGEFKQALVTCPSGTRLLGGGFEWGDKSKNGNSVMSSSSTFTGDANTTWEVWGRVDTGGEANTIYAEALCIAA